MSDIITTAKLSDEVFSFLASAGVDRALNWARSTRLNVFFSQLQEEIAKESSTSTESSKPDELLKKLLASEVGKDIIFDAYRRVSLAASKNLGPKIIAYLTAKLLIKGRLANEDEERMFNGAEILKDTDLIWFANNFSPDGKKPILHFKVSEAIKRRKNQIAILTTKPDNDFPFEVYKLQGAHVVSIEELGPLDEPQKRQRVVITSTAMREFVELIRRATGPKEPV